MNPSVATYATTNTTNSDITANRNSLARDIYDSKVLNCSSFSDHGYISFKPRGSIGDSSSISMTDPRFNYKKVNLNKFSKHILNNINDIFSMPLEK